MSQAPPFLGISARLGAKRQVILSLSFYCNVQLGENYNWCTVNQHTCLAFRRCWSGRRAGLRVAALRCRRLEDDMHVRLRADECRCWLLAWLLLRHVLHLLNDPLLSTEELHDGWTVVVLIAAWSGNGVQLLKQLDVWSKTQNGQPSFTSVADRLWQANALR